jgi:hypothetical protein
VLRYLTPTDRAIDPYGDIQTVLDAKKLKFNGSEVETWAGENASIFERGIAFDRKQSPVGLSAQSLALLDAGVDEELGL